MSTPPRKLALYRDMLRTWHFWVGAAYFGLVFVMVALYFQNGRILDAQRRANEAETVRVAEIQAKAASEYTQCRQSIPVLREFQRFIRGVQELHQTLLINARATHDATAPTDPIYTAQAENLARLERSVKLVSGVKLTVPTLAECRARRDKALGIS